MTSTTTKPVLVLGSTGKTGRRVADRLADLGIAVRAGSRSAELPFDWEHEGTWAPVLDGVGAAYVTYVPDLSFPEAFGRISRFVELAVAAGVERLVLLSGRGEPEAQRCEQVVLDAGVDATVVRASWFAQNFDEGMLADAVRDGVIALPTGDVPEPFIDVEDIADVAVAALTGDGHAGRVYEVTGPRLLTFAEAAAALAEASGRPVRFEAVSAEAFVEALTAAGMPTDEVHGLAELMTSILDGHNASAADGVQQALGRPPRDFADYARAAAARGAWSVPA